MGFDDTNQKRPALKTPWVLVAGSFHRSGGMDKANLALAEYLVRRGSPVHLVTHRVEAAPEFLARVTVHSVPLPGGSWFAGAFLLDRRAKAVIETLKGEDPSTVAVVNGSNCMSGDVNWSHYVHRGWKPGTDVWSARGLKSALERRLELRREKLAYQRARLVITNSELTRGYVEECLEGKRVRVQTVYLGGEDEWGPIDGAEREAMRKASGIAQDRKVAIFVGALSMDHRKGFDVLFEAWRRLCLDPGWDVDLIAAGSGAALEMWRQRVREAGLAERVQMLGFRKDIKALLAASDVLVSPTRYEPYGLNLQEALCRCLPVITSRRAGIVERFGPELGELVVEDVEDIDAWVGRLRHWRNESARWQGPAAALGSQMRNRGWMQMAAEMVELIEQ